MCAAVLLSCEQIDALNATQGRTIALILIGFVVPLQLITAIFSLLARDTVAGTALGLFTGAWLATALTMLSSKPGATSGALGVFLLTMSASLVVLLVGAAFGKAGLTIVIAAGVARFALTGLYQLTGSSALEHAAGIVGFALAGAALYAALATEIEDVRGGRGLPLGRRAKAAEALDAPFAKQLDQIEHEAGVRQQL